MTNLFQDDKSFEDDKGVGMTKLRGLPASVICLRSIHLPAVGERNLFQIRNGVDGEGVSGHGYHVAVLDRGTRPLRRSRRERATQFVENPSVDSRVIRRSPALC